MNSNHDLRIRPASADDADAITAIYNHYIRETVITFEEEEIDAAEMLARMAEVDAAGLLWFVAERDEQVIGYANAGKWKSRSGYRYAVEATVYLDPQAIGGPLHAPDRRSETSRREGRNWWCGASQSGQRGSARKDGDEKGRPL